MDNDSVVSSCIIVFLKRILFSLVQQYKLLYKRYKTDILYHAKHLCKHVYNTDVHSLPELISIKLFM